MSEGLLSRLRHLRDGPDRTDRSLADERARKQVLRLIQRLSQRLFAATSAQELSQRLLEAAREGIQADARAVLARQDQHLMVAAGDGLRNPDAALPLEELAGTRLAGCLEGQHDLALVKAGEADWLALRRLFLRSDLRLFLCLPLQGLGQVDGLLILAWGRSARGPSFGELELARWLALQVSQAQQRLERQRLATVGQLASDLAGDIQHAVEQVRAAMETTAGQSPSTTRYVQMILTQSDRVAEMSDQLLSVLRGGQSLTRCVVEVGEFMVALAETYSLVLQECGIQLELETEWGEACLDPTLLRRALVNLIDNARDAMPSGGILTLRARWEADALRLEVEDTGQGMPPDVLSHFCQPFFTHGKEHGTGLGTTVAKAITEAHGGRMEVRSEVGQGTCISLYLPLSNLSSLEPGPLSPEQTDSHFCP